MNSRIRSRKLFKRAVYTGVENLEPSLLRVSDRILAQEIAAEADVDVDYILVDNPPLPDTIEGSFPVLVGEEVRPLREVSPLVSILERAHRATWRFGVYAPAELRESVARSRQKVLEPEEEHSAAHIFR